MAGEHVSGVRFREGDEIKGYRILSAFDPGAFAFAGKAQSPSGRHVFIKKYKRPGSASPWYDAYVAYQMELKRRIEENAGTRSLCYEFVEFFEMRKPGVSKPLRAFYQTFEWVEGGGDLRSVLNELKERPAAYSWNQRIVFGRVVLASINALHKAGVIHCDLKPENFYLIPEPSIAAKFKVRVIDLDFSLLAGRRAPWHGHDGYVGTPQYMSPEHLREEVPTTASDAFTCALILAELLLGRHPASKTPESYDRRTLSGDLDAFSLDQPVPDVTDLAFLNHVLSGALRPDGRRRPTVEQMLHALSGRLAAWDGMTSSTAKPTPISTTILPPPARPATEPAKPRPTAAPAPATPRVATVSIHGGDRQHIEIAIPTVLGSRHFRLWSDDFERYMSAEQFRLTRDDAGSWFVQHSESATNTTTIEGRPIDKPTRITDGLVIGIGKSSKCQLTIRVVLSS
jgi:eukaryotic-like serine/threonine-protein kinase